MNTFIKKIIIYLALFFVIAGIFSSVIYYLFDNAVWGYSNNTERYRMNELITRGDEYNLVVFGSSYPNLQINTPYLDELSNDSIHSFNVGLWGISPGNIIKVMESMLPYIPNAKIVILDISAEKRRLPGVINKKFHYTLTTRGVISFLKNTVLGHKFLPQESFGVNIYQLTKIYSSKMLGIGIVDHLKRYYDTKNIPLPENNFSRDVHEKQGYIFLFEEATDSRKNFLYRLENDLSKLETFFDRKKERNKKALVGGYDISYDVDYEYQRYVQLAKLYQEAGKDVVFFVNPGDGETIFQTMEIARKLEKNGYNVYPFLDSEKYPELYDIKYSYDSNHLNYEGSIKFTEYMYEILYKKFLN
jgi:hypothetical protein